MKKQTLLVLAGLTLCGANLIGCGGADLASTTAPDETGVVEPNVGEVPSNDENGETPPPANETPDASMVAPNDDAPNFGEGIKGGRGLGTPPSMDPIPPSDPFVVHGVNFQFIPHGQAGTELPPVDRSCTTAEKTKFCGSESRTASCRGDETVDDDGNVTNTSFSYTCYE